MARNVILVAGQSGVSARECLRRVSDVMDGRPSILSLEDKMQSTSKLIFRSQILDECIPRQYEIWHRGFDALRDAVIAAPAAEPVFVSFHAVYQHPREREFFSPVDPQRFLEIQDRIKALVVLVDDVFDIFTRLQQPDEIYDEMRKLTGAGSIYAAIEGLVGLLQWRQLEITTSRLLARLLGVPFLEVATKHNTRVLARIAQHRLSSLRLLYFSHPITSVRTAGNTLHEFPAQANEIARSFSAHPGVVLFEPATIDEYGRFIAKPKGQLTPRLNPRWPLSSPKEEQIAPPLPPGSESDACLDQQQTYDSLNSGEYKVVDQLLRVLQRQIEGQVNSRDFSLVQQSTAGVVAYRPYYPDALSIGSKQELRHNRNLSALGLPKGRRCLVLSVEEDLLRRRVRQFFAQLAATVRDITPDSAQKLEQLCDKWLEDRATMRKFGDDAKLRTTIEELRPQVEHCLPGGYQFILRTQMTPLGGMASLKRRDNRRTGFDDACRNALVDDIMELLPSGSKYTPRIKSGPELTKGADELFRKVFRLKEERDG